MSLSTIAGHTTRTLTASVALALFASSAHAQGLEVSFSQEFYTPGEELVLKVCGEPGAPVCLLADTVCKPTFVPGVGELGLALSSSLIIINLPPIPADGCLLFTQMIGCDSDFLEQPVCFQAVSMDMSTAQPEIRISNVADLVINDEFGVCMAGCTPGYWKQSQHFDSWPAPYVPSMPFADVFLGAFPGLTLLDVLELGGGQLDALGRHTVAALLNAQAGFEVLDAQEVIDLFNSVAFSNDSYAIEDLKNFFADLNELGCPLN
jgi:hypothetical protein